MRIYIDVDENKRIDGWSSTPLSENSIEIEVEENHPVLMSYGKYYYIDGELVENLSGLLEDMKVKKDSELNTACRNAILDGFIHRVNGVDYHFSFDTEAQLNFQGAERLLNGGMTQEILWTVRKDGEYTRIPIDGKIINELVVAILKHKNDNVSKYRDILMPLVESATTIEEVNSISWDSLTRM